MLNSVKLWSMTCGLRLNRLDHKHNFVVKCEGPAWCETSTLRNLKRKTWRDMAYYIPTV